MMGWSIKRLYRESVNFRWGVRFFLLGTLIALLIFGYQEVNKKSDKQFFKEEFIKMQTICSGNQKNCTSNQSYTYVVIDPDFLVGNCANIHLEEPANISMPIGTISLVIEINPLDNKDKRFIFDMIDYSNKSFLELFVTENRIVQFKMHDKKGQVFIVSYDNEDLLYTPIQITATWSKELINLYINGKSKNSISLRDVDFDIPLKDWYVGSSHNQRYCLNGKVAQLLMLERDINQSEVNDLYNNGQVRSCEQILS